MLSETLFERHLGHLRGILGPHKEILALVEVFYILLVVFSRR